MTIAHVPKDESRRLRALLGIGLLDTPAEERFDRITRLAADHFAVPIAAITLIDADRQWCKSGAGVAGQESSRAVSFCAHAILHPEAATVVPDTLEDPRFADYPMVVSPPNVRFYAGHPIKAPAGEPLGTLCLIDVRPRELDDHQVARLADLAAWVEEEIRRDDDRGAIEQLRDSEARVWTLMNSVAEGIVSFSEDGRIRQVNHAAEEGFGYAPGALLGEPIGLLIAGHSSERIVASVARAPADGRPSKLGVRQVVDGRHRDGTIFPLELVITEARFDDERVLVAIGQDVTERVAAERVKDEFISVVGHELRTPLTAIRGSLGLLAGGVFGALPHEAGSMVDMAIVNTDRLVRLVNDMLDIERMDAGHLTLDRIAIPVDTLLQESLAAVQALADDAGVRVRTSPAPLTVLADEDRIVQTLVNLLGNAVKFSPPGGVVTVEVERDGTDACFTVHNSGRGVPADQLDHIFERFRQVDGTDAREKGGTGLGLAIARRIVDWHGGRIWAESPGGEGCILRFTLPLAQAAAVQERP